LRRLGRSRAQSIKPAKAHFHIEQAKRRLGVNTGVEAVAVGVLHGVI
jgi:DNA-binding CsgD family transcriptional regulator